MHYADRANILAVKLLLRQRRLSLPVDPFCLECGGKVVVDSVQHFSGVVGMKPQDFLCEQSEDCFAVLYRGRHFILYNRGVLSLSRRRWSIAHELGHIVLDHPINPIIYRNSEVDENQSPTEIQANIFARDLLMPAGVLTALHVTTVDEIMQICNVSRISAQIRLERLTELYKRNKFGAHPLERQVISQFKDFICSKK